MKKTIFLSAVLVLFMGFGTSYAQKGEMNLNLGVDLGLPMGDLGDFSSFGYGASAKGLYGISEDGQVELTIGYLSFPGKEDYSPDISMIPILAGYRHHFDDFYGEVQLGMTMSKMKLEIMGVSADQSSSDFTWALGLGYMFDAFDLSVRYQSVSGDGGSLSFIGLRIGYNFAL